MLAPPLIPPLEALERGAFPQMPDQLRRFFREVAGRVRRIDEQINSQRELLTSILEANLSLVSVRQNETSKQLTVIATIFLPLTFLTGFFGQNFGWMVDHITHFWAFAILGVGGMVASALALWAWLGKGMHILDRHGQE